MKLIKIDGYWIIVEKQIPNIDEFYWDDLVSSWKNVGILKMNGYADGNSTKKVISSYVGTTTPIQCSNRLIASNNPEHNLPSITFSEEVAKELGEVDVEKLAKISHENNGYESNDIGIYWGAFEHGYNQCKEDNKEKKYTEENLKFHINEFMEFCGKNYHYDAHFGWYEIGNPGHRPNNSTLVDKYVESLKQEYDVEIEMEEILFTNGLNSEDILKSEGLHDVSFKKPKITNNSITIIKLLK